MVPERIAYRLLLWLNLALGCSLAQIVSSWSRFTGLNLLTLIVKLPIDCDGVCARTLSVPYHSNYSRRLSVGFLYACLLLHDCLYSAAGDVEVKLVLLWTLVPVRTKQRPVLGTTTVFCRASCTLSAGPHFVAFAVPLSHLHN